MAAEIMALCERGEFVEAMHMLRECGEFESLLQLAAREQNLGVCKRLLSPECRFLWPKQKRLEYVRMRRFGKDALDIALSASRGGVDLPIVSLLVNAMRHKKGWLRENYITRIRSPGFENLLLTSLPLVEYLIRASVVFVAHRPHPSTIHITQAYNHAQISHTILALIYSGPRTQNWQVVDKYVSAFMSLAETFPKIFSREMMRYVSPFLMTQTHPHWLAHDKMALSALQLIVGLHMGWLRPTWSLLCDTVSVRHYNRSPAAKVVLEFLKTTSESHHDTLTVEMAHKIVRACLSLSCPPNIADQILELLESRFDPAVFRDQVIVPNFDFVLDFKYHDVSATLFLLKHTSYDQQQVIRIINGAHSSIAASVFYRCSSLSCGSDVLLRDVLMRPPWLAKILASASREMVYAVVWESDALATQLICSMQIHACRHECARESMFFRVKWVQEMFQMRMLLKGSCGFRRSAITPSHPSNLLTPSGGHPLPRNAGLHILAFAWLGNIWDFPQRLFLEA